MAVDENLLWSGDTTATDTHTAWQRNAERHETFACQAAAKVIIASKRK